ncbi:MAG: hypothetical protein OEL91_08615 [Burkholderiaceae bacterium]|nr:hypothetical protein [Burkholderiaceae bacterium]
MFNNAKLRLTMPEAYEVHRSVIQWKARYSTDRVPDQALGVDPVTAALMRWVMQSWARVDFFNKFLAGTWAPRIQMDFIPGLACAAHFLIVAKQAPASVDDYVAVGRSVQRFWLTLTHLGLVMQPELTPLIFSRYVRERTRFSRTNGMYEFASRLSKQLGALVGEQEGTLGVFMGRVGAGSKAVSRSTRLTLADLIVSTQ